MDLEGGGVGEMSVEGSDGYGFGSCGDDCQELLRKVTTVQGVGAVIGEVAGIEVVGTRDENVGKVRISR